MLDMKLPSVIPSTTEMLLDLPGPGPAEMTPSPVAVVATGVAAACSASESLGSATEEEPEKPLGQTRSLEKLMETLAEVDRLFQDAYKLARCSRDQDLELALRLQKAELEQRRCQQEAEHWRAQYQSLEKRVPWFVRRLFGA